MPKGDVSAQLHRWIIAALCSGAVAGCAAPSAESVRLNVERTIKPGMTRLVAVNKLESLGFKCHESDKDHQFCDQSYRDGLTGACVRNVTLYYAGNDILDHFVVSAGFCSGGWGK